MLIKYNIVNSTNDTLRNKLTENICDEFTCVIADEQTGGRGQRGNIWMSEKSKNLTFSFIIFPKFLTTENQFYISKYVSLSVISFLNEIAPGFNIKWPNDIYFCNKKIGGILIENSLSGKHLKSSIIGVGININQTEFNKNLPNPTSLKLITKKEFDNDYLIKSLIQNLKKDYSVLKNLNFNKIDKNYHSNLLYFNEFSTFKDKTGTFTGKIIKTEPSGRLVVETKKGEIKKFYFKEISFIHNFNKTSNNFRLLQ